MSNCTTCKQEQKRNSYNHAWKRKKLLHTAVSQFEGEQAPDISHTLTQTKTTEVWTLPWLLKTEFLKSDFLQPFINTKRWTGGTSVSDTGHRQHWPPLTTAWEPLLRVTPKAAGSEELNSSNMKAQGQSNFKLVCRLS